MCASAKSSKPAVAPTDEDGSEARGEHRNKRTRDTKVRVTATTDCLLLLLLFILLLVLATTIVGATPCTERNDLSAFFVIVYKPLGLRFFWLGRRFGRTCGCVSRFEWLVIKLRMGRPYGRLWI